MKFLLIPLVLILINSESCSESKQYKDLPSCIRNEIKQITEADVQNPPIQIHQYEYQGDKVYLISSPCCDHFDYIFNSKCEKLCAPFGGITGKGDNQCPDFQEHAVNKLLVWKDERNFGE